MYLVLGRQKRAAGDEVNDDGATRAVLVPVGLEVVVLGTGIDGARLDAEKALARSWTTCSSSKGAVRRPEYVEAQPDPVKH